MRRQGNPTGNRSDVDDCALAALSHARDHGLDAAKTAEEIGLHHLTKYLKRGFLHRAAAGDARVVDENVDRSKLPGDLGEGLANGGVVIDLERGQMNGKLFFLGYSTDFRAAIEISHGRGDRMSGAREGDGRRQPDAAARSGYQCNGHVPPPDRSPGIRPIAVGWSTLRSDGALGKLEPSPFSPVMTLGPSAPVGFPQSEQTRNDGERRLR